MADQAPQITLETFTSEQAVAPDQITDAHKSFLTEHIDEIDDATAERYGVEKAVKPNVAEPREEEKPIENPALKPKDGEEIDEEEVALQKKIQDEAARQTAPVREKIRQQQNVIEVDEFIQKNSSDIPTAGKFRQAMLDQMKKPGFDRLYAKDIFNIVAGGELMRIGAARERAAAAKAKSTHNPANGGSRGNEGAGKDWSNASSEEVAAKRMELMQGAGR